MSLQVWMNICLCVVMDLTHPGDGRLRSLLALGAQENRATARRCQEPGREAAAMGKRVFVEISETETGRQ